jgi:hypothetical protein
MWCDLLTFAVPMNMGSLEWTRMVVFKAVGYSNVAGMTYGLAIRLAQIFWSVLGLALYSWLMARENKPKEMPPAPLTSRPSISVEQKTQLRKDSSTTACRTS